MAPEAELDRQNHTTTLLAAFARHPAVTGTVTPSCRRIMDFLTEGIEVRSCGTVVELGAGSGAVTRVIESRVAADTTVVAVELNRDLARRLVARFPDHHVVNDSAERLPEVLADLGLAPADIVLSELPWTSFDHTMQARVVRAVSRSLHQGGLFTTTAYWPAARFSAGRRLRRLLKEEFSEVKTSPIVWGNIPPAFVYRCRK